MLYNAVKMFGGTCSRLDDRQSTKQKPEMAFVSVIINEILQTGNGKYYVLLKMANCPDGSIFC